MARVTFSPLITEMSGKCGDAVFSRWKGVAYVRERVTPANPRSDDQKAQRAALTHTLTMWQSIKSWAKAVWDRYASGYAKSGYNRYIEDNIKLVKTLAAGFITPYDGDYVKISDMDAAAGGAGEITLTWTNDSGVSDTDFVHVFYRKTETDAEEYAWTHLGAYDVILETGVITDLSTGEEYEVALFCSTADYAACQQSYNEILLAG